MIVSLPSRFQVEGELCAGCGVDQDHKVLTLYTQISLSVTGLKKWEGQRKYHVLQVTERVA